MSKKSNNIKISASDWKSDQPYNNLPKLPPPCDLETKKVLKACIKARSALAELKQAGELIPNPEMLISTLPLLEAQASSEIENIVTTSDKLFQFREQSETADSATKEALRYRKALMEGFQSLKSRPLSTRTAEQICSNIRDVEVRLRTLPGTALGRADGRIVYTPPVGESVIRELLSNWEKFLHNAREIDPLVRMAVGHYQFEAIHPFTDGNGRTGRILNSLFLIQEDLLTLPILYLSRYIIQNKSDYYRLLLAVTQTDSWEDWVLYILQGVEETSKWTTQKIAAIRALAGHTADYVRLALPKIYSHELIDLIFEKPYARIQNVIDQFNVQRQSASRYLQELAQIGVLEARMFGREKLYLHPRLLQLLTKDSNQFENYPQLKLRGVRKK
jgi:Fic family protein